MLRACFVVDGFNLYHSLRPASKELGLNGQGTKWLNLRKLCQSQLNVIRSGLALNSRLELGGIYYFTSLPTHLANSQPEAFQRHEKYIECLKLSGITVGLGNFHQKGVFCPKCSHEFELPEEKETDVNVGIKIAALTVDESCDVIVLVSGDSDICPAIRWAQSHNDDMKFVTMFPFGRGSNELRQVCDFHFKLKAQAYRSSQFDDPFVPYPGRRIDKPVQW